MGSMALRRHHVQQRSVLLRLFPAKRLNASPTLLLQDGIIVDEATGKVTDTKHKALTWQVISADMPIAIRGTKRAPECTIEVEQVLSGSVMAVTYDYE